MKKVTIGSLCLLALFSIYEAGKPFLGERVKVKPKCFVLLLEKRRLRYRTQRRKHADGGSGSYGDVGRAPPLLRPRPARGSNPGTQVQLVLQATRR